MHLCTRPQCFAQRVGFLAASREVQHTPPLPAKSLLWNSRFLYCSSDVKLWTAGQHSVTFALFAAVLMRRVSAALRPSRWLPPSIVLMLFAKPTNVSLNVSDTHCSTNMADGNDGNQAGQAVGLAACKAATCCAVLCCSRCNRQLAQAVGMW